jgi:hypothetical protein
MNPTSNVELSENVSPDAQDVRYSNSVTSSSGIMRQTYSTHSNTLFFYQKPEQRNSGARRTQNCAPIQILGPKEMFSIGLSPNVLQVRDANNNHEALYVGSAPELISERDVIRLRGYVMLFSLVGCLNAILTIFLYVYADKFDSSKVSHSGPYSVERIPSQRTSTEYLIFSFTLINLFIGIISAMCKSPLGLSFYSLGSAWLFFIGFTNIPYFMYGVRYVLDALLVYIALSLRAKLMHSFLQFNYPAAA